jgi:hypothetical protein
VRFPANNAESHAIRGPLRTENETEKRESERLLTDAKSLNNGLITLRIVILQVIEQAATLADHHKKASTGSVVLFVRSEVVGKLDDPLAKHSDLDLRATGVSGVGAVLVDDRCFMLSC